MHIFRQKFHWHQVICDCSNARHEGKTDFPGGRAIVFAWGQLFLEKGFNRQYLGDDHRFLTGQLLVGSHASGTKLLQQKVCLRLQGALPVVSGHLGE